MVDEIPPKECTERVVYCDGGDPHLGHPKVYINLVRNIIDGSKLHNIALTTASFKFNNFSNSRIDRELMPAVIVVYDSFWKMVIIINQYEKTLSEILAIRKEFNQIHIAIAIELYASY